MAWMPARQAVENVNSGVTIGGEDNSSPLFVRPPWQARLLIPIYIYVLGITAFD